MDTDLEPRSGTHAVDAASAPQGASAADVEDLVQALRDPACYPHPVDRVEVIETHISWVLLAGDFAYKLKKPVRLSFLDFSALAARRHYCEEELRLNARTAPAIYLAVVGIGGDRRCPRIVAADARAFEYAVKMRRFAPDALLSTVARAGRLEAAHVDALAEALARLHARAERGRGAHPARAAFANFDELAARGRDAGIAKRLEALRRWTVQAASALSERFAERAADGFVRECHGDLHLANVALVGGEPLPFDAIEFSPALRWIDVASDLAFAAMDLVHHGYPGLAMRLVDRYLERTGDDGALRVLRFYAVYRAMVRAKVASIALGQAHAGSPHAHECAAELAQFVGVAERLALRGPALVVLMHGLSGSGKSVTAQRLAGMLEAVRVRSDVERKRLRGLEIAARAGAAPGQGIYAEADDRATYARLEQVARSAISGGYPVIVDAAFLRLGDRERFRALARELGAQLRIVACTAPEALLRARVIERERLGRDPSDAGPAVLGWQAGTLEPVTAGEAPFVVDTAAAGSEAVIEEIAGRLLASSR